MNARERAVERLAAAILTGERDPRLWGEVYHVTQEIYRKRARRIIAELGLVAIDPALVEAVEVGKRTAIQDAEREGYVPDPTALTSGPYYDATPSDYAVACAALAVDVLAQLREGGE